MNSGRASPAKGPTLSTSTSSFEALDPHDPNLSTLANVMFQKAENYITSELNACLKDYELLQKMNESSSSKYFDMTQIAENIFTSTVELKNELREVIALVEKIDDIENSVNKLESAAYKLDANVVTLEEKFKSLNKQNRT